ncbi:uncharacterized protein Saf6 [Ochlerotatus camptorhynchus]|uniref:uncharacterized protein Saf6 n=1 Tax=Ochlerotatus camptorhynchus TaxID=644619 RepID=UPI0031E342AB
MKPSPKKSVSSKLKHRTKSSSSGSASSSAAASNAVSNSNNIGNNSTSGGGGLGQMAQQHHHHHHQSHQQLRSIVGAATTAGGSDTNSSGNDANSSAAGKDKGSYKSYAGFSSRSVRTIWEQHDKQETEVTPEVYNKLAEDTTYKLWELANSIKTYTRHSSGRVTYDLVNEVLKDCDIPPIVGANNEPWDKIEYDGVYFFNSDEVLDLREEYIKDVTMEQSNIPVLTTSWMAESAIAEDLIELYNNVCDAVYLGDDKCFEEAIEILSSNAHVPSLMKLLLTKVIEMLGFEYTECTLVRSLQFLEALVRNYHISHSDLTLELSLLSQIFVNLLLGAASFMQSKFIVAPSLNLDLQPQSQTSQHQQPLSINQNGTEPSPQGNIDQLHSGFGHSTLPMNILDNNLAGPSEDSNNSNSNTTEELLRSIENIKEGPDGIDINNIKDEYEALFSMVQGLGKQEVEEDQDNITGTDGFQIKTEFNNDFDASTQNFMVQQPPPILGDSEMTFDVKPEIVDKLKQEPAVLEDPDDNVSLQMSESTNGEVINPNSTTLESENITTLICADYLVDEVSRIIGLCSSKWGFLEQECTFLLVERLQRYFGEDRKPNSIDYHWLSRILRGLWSVGEFSFREMIPYFEKIDPEHVPEFVNPYLNNAGLFLQGRSDIFLYEYLSEICGIGLLPFMFQYEQYIESKHQTFHRLRERANQGKQCYKIAPKVLLKVHPKPCHLKPPPTVHDFFPERIDNQLAPSSHHHPSPRFNFRFAGCRPVGLKSNKTRFTNGRSLPSTSSYIGMQVNHDGNSFHQPAALKQNDGLLRNFQAKVVIARRRLLAPDTNQRRPRKVYCYGSTTL